MQAVRFGTTYRIELTSTPPVDRARMEQLLAEKKAAGVDAEYSLQVWNEKSGRPRIDWFVLTDEGYDKALSCFRYLKKLQALFTSKEKNRLPRWESLQVDKLAREFEKAILYPLLERAKVVPPSA